MFICAVHANTIKFFGIIGLTVVAIALLVIFIPGNNTGAISNNPAADALASAPVLSENAAEAVSFEKVKTNEDRIALLGSYGWEVEAAPTEEADITIPAEFDRVMESYNALQKQQGFDLEKYRNRDMKRYTYRITNFEGYNGTVYANLLVYKNRVVAGDICSSDVNGFIYGLSGKSAQ